MASGSRETAEALELTLQRAVPVPGISGKDLRNLYLNGIRLFSVCKWLLLYHFIGSEVFKCA